MGDSRLQGPRALGPAVRRQLDSVRIWDGISRGVGVRTLQRPALFACRVQTIELPRSVSMHIHCHMPAGGLARVDHDVE